MSRLLRSVLPPLLLVACLIAGSAGTAEANTAFTLEVADGKAIKIGPVGFDFIKLNCIVTNTSGVADSYDIFKDSQGTPLTWDVSICVGGDDGTCYAPFIDESLDDLPIAAGESDTVSIYFTPLSGEGEGYADLTLVSVNDNSCTETVTLGAITDGCTIVIVDDSPNLVGGSLDEAASGFTDVGLWDRSLSVPTAADLATFPVTWWITGTNTNTLDTDDQATLATFLGNGGRLAISGQDVAFDLCDPGSPNQSPASLQWFEDWMNAQYVSNDSGSFSLTAVEDDPVAQGIDLTLNGGDGANNQTDPDVVAPLVGGGEAWTYATGGAGAVRAAADGYRAVFMGFGFEAIDALATRQQVLLNTVLWLTGSVIGVDDQDAAGLRRVIMDDARPNPFNPSVSIPFALEQAAAVSLRVIDSNGRVVRTLVDGPLGAGEHVQAWDGLDDRGVAQASGVYHVELRAAGEVEAQKVVLTK